MFTISVNKSGFSQLTYSRLYVHMVRPQLEYGFAINTINSKALKLFESCQYRCICRIFGGRSSSSTKVMLHITNLPRVQEHTHILSFLSFGNRQPVPNSYNYTNLLARNVASLPPSILIDALLNRFAMHSFAIASQKAEMIATQNTSLLVVMQR
ncbi:hypothetical protein A0J61_06720 [Choanephora cucurbitarum]|uniref:Uncharacterized protein n=1 Tax=Choanephora cucurbitarum TaxID=101091 RepID=A0A1C7N7U7_9FUNG|nr:hypothetical protein A0J61_06720 [Choanephora cucurbitarum]